MDYRNQFLLGNVMNVLRQLPEKTMDCVVTSPPYYGLRTYGGAETVWGGTDECEHRWEPKTHMHNWERKQSALKGISGEPASAATGYIETNFCSLCSAWRGELGLEPTPELYLTHLWAVFDEIWRVMKKTGTMWVNIGDTYASSPCGNPTHTSKGLRKGQRQIREQGYLQVDKRGTVPAKCLLAVPERFMLGMCDRGWILRNKVVWHKPNPMPSSAKDRFTTVWEYVYFFTKAKKYWFDLDAVRERHGSSLEADTKPSSVALDQPHIHHRMRAGGNPSGKNPSDVWRITTQPFPLAHFATFPEELARRCIKAGCPKEVCPKCGKGKVRITKPSEGYAKQLGQGFTDHKMDDSAGLCQPKRDGFKSINAEYQTLGWTSCSCGAGYVPGIMLDPFGGSGRACHVAWEQGRDFTYIDIKPEYIEMAKDGLEKKMRSIPRAGNERQAERTGQETLEI